MGTKQIKMEFQVTADDGISAQVAVTINGVQKFSGPLAHTVDVMPGQVSPDTMPYSLVEFDLDVPGLPDPLVVPYPAPMMFYYNYWTTPMDVIIAVTGGSITLQETETNYTVTAVYDPPPTGTEQPTGIAIPQPGTADAFYTMWYTNQPVWTPEPANPLNRFNYQYNVDNNTGPGSLLVLENESVAFQMAVPLYSS